MDEIRKVLNENFKKLIDFPNVLNVGIGHKWVNGVKTEELCIKVYVSEKKPETMLAPKDVLPKSILGISLDVVELSEPGISFGETEVSKRDPEIQRRLASGVKG